MWSSSRYVKAISRARCVDRHLTLCVAARSARVVRCMIIDMLRTQPRPDAISRHEAIDMLREELLKRVDADTSMCRVAAEQRIFCQGFRRFGERELRRRFDWIGRRLEHTSRQELEEIADRWQLARQDVRHLPIACDVQQIEHDACRGWDDFTNEELSRFYLELTGHTLIVG